MTKDNFIEDLRHIVEIQQLEKMMEEMAGAPKEHEHPDKPSDVYQTVKIHLQNDEDDVAMTFYPEVAWQSYAKHNFFKALQKTIMKMASRKKTS